MTATQRVLCARVKAAPPLYTSTRAPNHHCFEGLKTQDRILLPPSMPLPLQGRPPPRVGEFTLYHECNCCTLGVISAGRPPARPRCRSAHFCRVDRARTSAVDYYFIARKLSYYDQLLAWPGKQVVHAVCIGRKMPRCWPWQALFSR